MFLGLERLVCRVKDTVKSLLCSKATKESKWVQYAWNFREQ